MPVCLSVCLFVCLSFFLSVFTLSVLFSLFVWLSTCLLVCLFLSLSVANVPFVREVSYCSSIINSPFLCIQFDSSSGILDANTFDEYAVIIYMAVLRRKVS